MPKRKHHDGEYFTVVVLREIDGNFIRQSFGGRLVSTDPAAEKA